MLTKAILTGGVLSLLAGSIVYFGTEGADASDWDNLKTSRVETPVVEGEETELAGAIDTDVVAGSDMQANAETPTPPKRDAEPKTRWLDQYLKRKDTDAKDVDVTDAPEDMASDVMSDDDKSERKGARDAAKGSYLVSEDERPSVDIERTDRKRKAPVGVKDKSVKAVTAVAPQSKADYAQVLAQADKLLVTDMRDAALLEVIDYAIDQGDMLEAADVLDGLSTPELRDTARARIGRGLARQGNGDAAFAALESIEIEELTAPIRLEIITELMATQKERASE